MRNVITYKKPAAKAARPSRATPAPTTPVEFKPLVRFKPTLIAQGDGSFLVIPGKPIVTTMEDELKVSEFAKFTRLSQRYVLTLCEQGRIKHRRKSNVRKSQIWIPASEVERYLNIEETEEAP